MRRRGRVRWISIFLSMLQWLPCIRHRTGYLCRTGRTQGGQCVYRTAGLLLIPLAKPEARTVQGQHAFVNPACQSASLGEHDFAVSLLMRRIVAGAVS
jgi:hypothetical protein